MDNYQSPAENAGDGEVQFEILSNANQKGGKVLVSSNGYSFNLGKVFVTRDGDTRSYWTCAVSGCRGRVKQSPEGFKQNGEHIHEPTPCLKELKMLKREERVADLEFENAQGKVNVDSATLRRIKKRRQRAWRQTRDNNEPPGRFPKFLTESFQERVLGSSSSSAVKVDVKADLKRKLPKSSFDLDSDVTKKACDVLTEADDVHLWALSLAADLRSIDKPMARKRVMHSISGLLLDELEKYEAEKALAKSTTYEIVSFQSANTDTAEVIATEAATAVETSTSG